MCRLSVFGADRHKGENSGNFSPDKCTGEAAGCSSYSKCFHDGDNNLEGGLDVGSEYFDILQPLNSTALAPNTGSRLDETWVDATIDT